MSHQLKELNEDLSIEFALLSAAFCRDSIFTNRSFAATCKYNFALRRWCEEHSAWHVIPARKRKPWRLVSDAEELVLDRLAADESVVHLQKAFWDVRSKNAAYFDLLEELEANAMKARREQRKLKAKSERANRQPPRVAAEFIPRVYLMEFATCYRKTQYETESAAHKAIYVLHAKEIEQMNVYRCSYCRNHHVGHKPRRKQSPATVFKHAKKCWRDFPKEADRFVVERNLLHG